MPELPEVQALAGFLADRTQGRTISRVEVVAFSALKTFDPPVSALEGRTVEGVERRGKFLDLIAGGDLHLVFHLARAGWVRWNEPAPAGRPKPGRGPLAFRLVLEPDSAVGLTEAGTQKRLAVYLVRHPDEVPGVARLGIDPLSASFTPEALAGLLEGHRAQIKGVLTDQTVLAGVGNAYSDEALHRAGLSPYKKAGSLDGPEVARLHEAVVGVLTEAVGRSSSLGIAELKGDKKRAMQVHGRTGEPCPVCGDTIRQVSFATRSLQYCPTCQTGGKPLADRRLSRLLK